MEAVDGGSAPNRSGEEPVRLFVKNPTDKPGTPPHLVCASVSESVSNLKEKIAKDYPGHPSVDNQRLIFSGKLLDNDSTLGAVFSGFDVSQPQTLHLVISGRSQSEKTPRSEPGSSLSPSVVEGAAAARTGSVGGAPPPRFASGQPVGVGQHPPSFSNGAPVPHFAYPMGMPPGPGAPSPAGVMHGAPHMYGPHGPFPPGPYMSPYYYPGVPALPYPPPPDDGVPGGDPGSGPAANAGAGMLHQEQPLPNVYGPYGTLGMDPNYVAHLEAMRQRFEQDLAAQQQQHNVGGDDANQRRGFGIAVHAVNMNGGPANADAAADAFPNGRNGRNANGPHVRHFAFQFELNWSLISKLIFVVILLSQEGSSQRVYALAAAAVAVYLWQTGRLRVLRRAVGSFVPTPTQLFDMVAPAVPDGDARQPVSRSVIALSYAYSFVYGLVCSLLPSWEPVPLPHLQLQRNGNAELTEERHIRDINQEPNRQDGAGERAQGDVN